MKSKKQEDKREILIRLVISLALIVIVCIIWILTDPIRIKIGPEWISNVTAELVVLALAGIWISYIVERSAAQSTRDDIDSRFDILKNALQAKIQRMYYDEAPHFSSRQTNDYRQDLISELGKTRGEVRILAIAAREFLHEGQGFAYHTMMSIMRDQPVRLLLLHPWSEQAVSRALQEDQEHSNLNKYKDSRLFQDVLRSCEAVAQWTNTDTSNIQMRLYKVAPSCFLIFVNDVLFVEQYHFGTGGRASGKVPVFQVSKGSKYYEQMNGHFEHVWNTAEPYRVTEDFVKNLKEPDLDFLRQFKECIQFSRPDLLITNGQRLSENKLSSDAT